MAIRGPERLWGGWDYGTSHYVFDPEGNEVEFRTYPKADTRHPQFAVSTERAEVSDAELVELVRRAGSTAEADAVLEQFAPPCKAVFVRANAELIAVARRLDDGTTEFVIDPPYRAVGHALLGSHL